MRIGISVCSNYRQPDARQSAQHMVERARAANQAGLDSLFVGDHHATPTTYLQNVPMLGRMLAEWDDRPVGALFLLPLWNPVLLAEQVGTLASIARGRFILQTGLGGELTQSQALGVDFGRRVGMFNASLQVMRALWNGERASEERYWGIQDAQIRPVPPEPVEVWVGAQAPAAVRRTARAAEGWLASPSLTIADAAAAANQYRQACAEFDRVPTATAIRRDVCLQRSDEQATKAVSDVVARGYRGFSSEALVIGSVAAAEDHFAALAEGGYTDVIMRNISQDQKTALETIELMGEVRDRVHAL